MAPARTVKSSVREIAEDGPFLLERICDDGEAAGRPDSGGQFRRGKKAGGMAVFTRGKSKKTRIRT
jgi:hypothetical protein